MTGYPHDPDRWTGIDLDGVLAYWSGKPEDVLTIGPPIPSVLALVKRYLAEGRKVRILTARVAACGTRSAVAVDDQAFADAQRVMVESWCQRFIGQVLPITATKDWQMDQFLDDHCVEMIANTGMSLREVTEGLYKLAHHYADCLNAWDGGSRNLGETLEEWVGHLVKQAQAETKEPV